MDALAWAEAFSRFTGLQHWMGGIVHRTPHRSVNGPTALLRVKMKKKSR